MHYHKADVRMSLCHSQWSSSATTPVLNQYARQLLSCHAHACIAGHMWHVLRLQITKEEAWQLSHLPGMFPLHLLWSMSMINSPSTTFCAKNQCQWMWNLWSWTHLKLVGQRWHCWRILKMQQTQLMRCLLPPSFFPSEASVTEIATIHSYLSLACHHRPCWINALYGHLPCPPLPTSFRANTCWVQCIHAWVLALVLARMAAFFSGFTNSSCITHSFSFTCRTLVYP